MTLPEGAIRQLEIQGRYVLAAPLLSGQRVLDVGGLTVAGLVQLAQGEPAEVAVTHAEPRVLMQELDQAGVEGLDVQTDGDTLPFEDGSYDLVICHDLADRLHSNPRFIDEIRRVLAPQGYLLTAVANPDGHFLAEVGGTTGASILTFEELNDQVAPHFSARTVFGQSPVVASLFFDFDDESEEPGLTLDRALMPDDDERPGWCVLLYGPEPLHHDHLTIAQLPFAIAVEAAQSQADEASASKQALEQETTSKPGILDPAAAQVIRTLEAEREAALARAMTAEAALQAHPEREPQLESRLAELEGSTRTQTLQHELDRVRHDKSSYEAQIKDLLEEVGQLRSREEKRQQELQHMQSANAAAHQQLLQVQKQLQERASAEPDGRIIQLQQELMAAQEELRTIEATRQGLENEMVRLRANASAATQPVASRPRDAVGRVLDTAVEELEDLLKDVAPPVSSGR